MWQSMYGDVSESEGCDKVVDAETAVEATAEATATRSGRTTKIKMWCEA
jgi:hypothetical protein